MKGVKKALKINLETKHKFLKGVFSFRQKRTSRKKAKTTLDSTLVDEKIKSPNVNKVPLEQADHKSWLDFKNLDEGRPALEMVSARDLSEEGKWSIPLDHPFIPVIVDFAISAFNEVRHKHLKKKKKINNLCHSQVMDCRYSNMFYSHVFYMTVEAIEEGILGVYRLIVGCGVIDGSKTLIHFILSDRRPKGKIALMLPHLISQKYIYKNMKSMKKDLEVTISETTEKSMQGNNERKMAAAELIRLKDQLKAMEGICKMLYRQIRSQIPKTWNDRNHDDPDVQPVRTSGLYPRSCRATCKGYDYYTNNSEFVVFAIIR